MYIAPDGKAIEGKYDIGHKAGYEYRKIDARADKLGLTQQQVNEYGNNPDILQIEDRSKNQSHKYEAPDEIDYTVDMKQMFPYNGAQKKPSGELDMSNIDVGKVTVDPFKFVDNKIEEVRIEKKLNEHSTLYVRGTVKDADKFTPATDKTETTKIECKNDKTVYFNGVLQSVKVTCVGETYLLEAYAISNTILLDTVKHKRSFQNNNNEEKGEKGSVKYEKIVNEVIATNGKGSIVSYNAPDMDIENIILQYNETDWEFAKRLASHTNDVLIPITTDKPAFHFGAPDTGDAKLESSTNYSVSNDFDALRRLSAKDNPLTANDITIYTVEANELICELGEKLNLSNELREKLSLNNETELHVCHILLSFVKKALTVTYTLCEKKAISTPKFYNRAITGLVLDGTVLKVENDKVALRLDNAEDKNKERSVEQDRDTTHLFKYATGYSADGHTGWYVMPEKDDTVQLLFPSEDEKYAYATSSVRKEGTETDPKKKKENEKTDTPDVKYWRTRFGKEIKMDKEEILITSKDKETFIRINEKEGILIQSEEDVKIFTKKNLFIQAEDSIKMVCGGNVMKFDPSEGIAISTDKKFKLVSEDDAILYSPKEVDIKSDGDMKLDSGSKLTSKAGSKIELSSDGSSIMLQSSGIDVKGNEIREN